MDESGATPPPQPHPDGNLQGSEEAQTFKRHGQTRHISPRDFYHQRSDLLQPLVLQVRAAWTTDLPMGMSPSCGRFNSIVFLFSPHSTVLFHSHFIPSYITGKLNSIPQNPLHQLLNSAEHLNSSSFNHSAAKTHRCRSFLPEKGTNLQEKSSPTIGKPQVKTTNISTKH